MRVVDGRPRLSPADPWPADPQREGEHPCSRCPEPSLAPDDCRRCEAEWERAYDDLAEAAAPEAR